MNRYRRDFPSFSLCGLNCALCPMYHISEENHCTGCGGEGRPTCAVIRCSLGHGRVQYCFQCEDYPCERYRAPDPYDSFLPHRNVLRDFDRAKTGGLDQYRAMLEEKAAILRRLLAHYNDGRRKSFFCTAVNLLELEDVRDVMARAPGLDLPLKERAADAAALFREMAQRRGVELRLRKKGRG